MAQVIVHVVLVASFFISSLGDNFAGKTLYGNVKFKSRAPQDPVHSCLIVKLLDISRTDAKSDVLAEVVVSDPKVASYELKLPSTDLDERLVKYGLSVSGDLLMRSCPKGLQKQLLPGDFTTDSTYRVHLKSCDVTYCRGPDIELIEVM